MKTFLILFLCSIGICQITTAQDATPLIYPQVQKINIKNGKVEFSNLKITGSVNLLNRMTENNPLNSYISATDKKAFTVQIGMGADWNVHSLVKKVNAKEGAYYIKITNKTAIIAANDTVGVFYGLQSLSQLIQNHQMPLAEINDFPSSMYRGVVEGFYGKPWSQENRISQFEFYGKIKANTYIYGPKDDPYHSSPNWRLPYPKEQATQLKELVKVAKQNFVNFVWAIHPGKDIKWNDEDRKNILKKFESMYQLGLRSYAVFFDDISGEGTDAQKQAELLNFLNAKFVKVKKDVKPLIMCPTEYNKSWANTEKGSYLDILGDKLDPSIQVMWTGDKVVADITLETLHWIDARIKRPALIWWNFPVSDYVRDHLLLGKSYGLDTKIKDEMSGILSNPMEHAEASKFAIFGLADFAWQMKSYHPDASWQQSIYEILPKSAGYFTLFAENNSDMGKNGHGYRREESVKIAPILQQYIQGIKDKNINTALTDSALSIFTALKNAPSELLKINENPDLMQDIKPWLEDFEWLNDLGLANLKLSTQKIDDESEFWNALLQINALKNKGLEREKSNNANPYQPGVKTGTLVIKPFVDSLQQWNSDRFYTTISNADAQQIASKTGSISSDVPQLQKAVIELNDKELRIKPILELIAIPANSYLKVELPYELQSAEIKMNLDGEDLHWANIEVSKDGQRWFSPDREDAGKEIVNRVDQRAFKYIKLENIGLDSVTIKLNKFSVSSSEFNPQENIFAFSDHNLNTAYALKPQQVIETKSGMSNPKFITILSDVDGVKFSLSYRNAQKKVLPLGSGKLSGKYLKISLPNDCTSILIGADQVTHINEIIWN